MRNESSPSNPCSRIRGNLETKSCECDMISMFTMSFRFLSQECWLKCFLSWLAWQENTNLERPLWYPDTRFPFPPSSSVFHLLSHTASPDIYSLALPFHTPKQVSSKSSQGQLVRVSESLQRLMQDSETCSTAVSVTKLIRQITFYQDQFYPFNY